MKIHDISPLVSSKTAVFPGDKPYRREVVMDFPKDHLALSNIETTVHIGAHVDAPNHYREGLEGIHQRDLSYYVGPCQVITAQTPRGKAVCKKDLRGEVQAERVLLKTGSFPDPNRWNSDFCSVESELVRTLSRQGVRLIGIDTPSIDHETSQSLAAHNAVADCDMAILEGVVLEHVPDGVYELIALPLKLEDADASPVRAVLIERN